MIQFLVALLVGCVGLASVLMAWSPGHPAPLVDGAGRPIHGSTSEKVFVEINGLRQGMFIQSADTTHPVLLFLHGGPGMPEFFLDSTHPTGLEEDFTVVWWEQRGSGLSYRSDIPRESMTPEQLIADAIAVTDYLRQRFAQEKIYLLGHSWGSFLGIQMVAEAPERFHAYIGMGQISYQLRSEVTAHRYMLEQYRARGDSDMVRRLEAATASMTDGLSPAYERLRDEAMHRLGVGTTRDMDSVITGVFFPVWQCRAYTVREKINIWRGKLFSRGLLWNDVLGTDLTSRIVELDLPVYFLIGRHDYTTGYEQTREYFARIEATVKGFYTFEESAHSPLFEEPERARQILRRDVLTLGSSLADGQE